jgi:glycosyltransferase involved in cell wall biosynthesis
VISVVIPVQNGMPLIVDQLQAVVSQSCDQEWEVVVADNGSTDDTASNVQKFIELAERVRLIDASAVTGPGAVRNIAVGQTKGNLLAFCDADDVVQPGWLQSYSDALKSADVAGGLTDYWSLNDESPPADLKPRKPPAKSQFHFLEAAMSSNLAVRREAFETIKGFSEDLIVGEDTDFCWRLQIAGYRFVSSDALIARRDRQSKAIAFRRFVEYGRCGPILYRRHRFAGMRSEPAAAANAWVWLVVSVPKLIQPSFRMQWLRVAGWRIGRLLESAKQKVFFP